MGIKGALAILLIVVLGLLVYANSLKGDFIWDDIAFIKQNPLIKSWSGVTRILTNDTGRYLAEGRGKVKYNFYRPLQVFTFIADYSLWKLEPAGWHLTNILLHILSALAIWQFINVLSGDGILSLFASALFLVHPVHTEAVAYISGRADPLALALILLSFILYIKYTGTGKIAFYAACLLTYALAILSRENSLILPALLLLYHYSFKKKIRAGPYAAIAAITIACVFLRVAITKELLAGGDITRGGAFQRVPGFFVAITNYARILILPFGLHMEYGDPVFSFGNPRAISGALILLSSLIYAFRKRRSDPLVSFSIFWFFISIFPSSNIYPLSAYMAEHWLYLPSVGFFLILAKGILVIARRYEERAVAMTIMAVAVIIFYSVLTIRQNNYWRDPVSFYKRTLIYSPKSEKIYNNLGVAHHDAKKYEGAIGAYKKALELNPYYLEVWCNLGTALHDAKRYDEAVEAYKREIAINPNYPKVYNNLGALYSDLGKYEEAAEAYKKAIELKPDAVEMRYNLGLAYYNLGRFKEAAAAYKKALSIDPNYQKAYNDLAMVYHQSGDYETAISLYRKAVKIGPSCPELYYNLALAFTAMRRNKEAINSYEQALKLNPDYAAVHNNLAILYFYEKQYDLAARHCDKALELGHKVSPAFLKDLAPRRKQ